MCFVLQAGRPEMVQKERDSCGALHISQQELLCHVKMNVHQSAKTVNFHEIFARPFIGIKDGERDERNAPSCRGEYTKAECGSQIRSYVLLRIKWSKDHRMTLETGNTQRC